MCRKVWGFESLRGHQEFRKNAASLQQLAAFFVCGADAQPDAALTASARLRGARPIRRSSVLLSSSSAPCAAAASALARRFSGQFRLGEWHAAAQFIHLFRRGGQEHGDRGGRVIFACRCRDAAIASAARNRAMLRASLDARIEILLATANFDAMDIKIAQGFSHAAKELVRQ